MDFIVIIPARYGSSRFPGKPLADIRGKPMVQHVAQRALEAGATRVLVATDDRRIADVAGAFVEVCMTGSHHQSGTERIAEVIDNEKIADDAIIVNVQGDEPFVPAINIRQVAANLASDPQAVIATLATPIKHAKEVLNPNIVKVVRNRADHGIYFSRAVIPFERDRMLVNPDDADASKYLRHIGLYAYRAGYVRQYVNYAPSELEAIESLEQLRALWYGDVIHVDVAKAPPPAGIDTPEDLEVLLNTLTDSEQGESAK